MTERTAAVDPRLWVGRRLRPADRRGAVAAHVVRALALVSGAVLATQLVASRLGYHRNLGPWIYRAPVGAARGLGWLAIVAGAACLVLVATGRQWRWIACAGLLAGLGAIALGGGPVYAPTRVFVWYAGYHRVAAYRSLFHAAWAVLVGTAVGLVVTLDRLVLWRAPSRVRGARDDGSNTAGADRVVHAARRLREPTVVPR